MFDFDVENLVELSQRISESRKTETIFNLEFVSTYLEIKETLIAFDNEQVMDTKIESLQNSIKILELYKKTGISDLDKVSRALAFQKFIETYIFLKNRYTQGLTSPIFDLKGKKLENENESEKGRLKIKVKEDLFWQYFFEFYNTIGCPSEEIRNLLNKEIEKSNELNNELSKNFGNDLGDKNRNVFIEEAVFEKKTMKEFSDFVIRTFCQNVEDGEPIQKEKMGETNEDLMFEKQKNSHGNMIFEKNEKDS